MRIKSVRILYQALPPPAPKFTLEVVRLGRLRSPNVMLVAKLEIDGETIGATYCFHESVYFDEENANTGYRWCIWNEPEDQSAEWIGMSFT